MAGNRGKNGVMRFAIPAQGAVLELDESADKNLPRWKPIQPTLKFGQVLFFYRLPNLVGSELETDLNDARVVAVIA